MLPKIALLLTKPNGKVLVERRADSGGLFSNFVLYIIEQDAPRP